MKKILKTNALKIIWKDKPETSHEKKTPGRFAEGPRHPGFILLASAVSEQENRCITQNLLQNL